MRKGQTRPMRPERASVAAQQLVATRQTPGEVADSSCCSRGRPGVNVGTKDQASPGKKRSPPVSFIHLFSDLPLILILFWSSLSKANDLYHDVDGHFRRLSVRTCCVFL
ncbi:hypothetical protein ElyMa_006236800 [Elysia marginata]|uniref:Uncharacterized protein n=1 Tax=Elysia marginata TaxID=1093978 RepID=A0AAV4HAT6_9GAST|nr:hypothetical protein ElyMa_006236800 [Elysia marginata]